MVQIRGRGHDRGYENGKNSVITERVVIVMQDYVFKFTFELIFVSNLYLNFLSFILKY